MGGVFGVEEADVWGMSYLIVMVGGDLKGHRNELIKAMRGFG
jgi:hypothetical protein